ncbi:MAG: hypothetical protein AAGI11_15640 [Pseudomonadota bacterium]
MSTKRIGSIRVGRVIVVILALLVAWTAVQTSQNLQVEKIPARDRSLKLNVNSNAVLLSLSRGEDYDRAIIEDVATYVGRRFDTSDFRLQSLARILYRYPDGLLDDDFQTVKSTFLNFKYWMDQPGEDSICFWSENHQLLFAASEYLAGQYWPEEVFTNTGLTGREHLALARNRILTWLEQRWQYGFTEWYSNTYYVEDIAPLANLIDFAEDPEIVIKAQIILDLLLYDLASQSWRGRFISSSGRMYEKGKRYPERNGMQAVVDHIWPPEQWQRGPSGRLGMDLNFLMIENYEVPPAIEAIGNDDATVVIKASQGLNLDELVEKDLVGVEDPQIMMQLAMEAFSNPEVISNTVRYMRLHNMFGNEFLYDFRYFNLDVLKYTGLLPVLSRILNPVTNGVAIQRANTYTYRTADFMIATAQAYHPGSFGDQQHLWNAQLPNDISLFTTHPAAPLSDEGALSGSPGYWVGSGRFPHVVQEENVVINIFQPPAGKGFMEKSVQDFTHAHFPASRFDEHNIEGRYAFGRAGDSYAALISASPLAYAEGSDSDLIQEGMDAYWIFEAGSANRDGDYERFKARILANEVNFEAGQLRYASNARSYALDYQGDFSVDGEVRLFDYPRFDSPWASEEREPETIRISHGEHTLELDFHARKRQISRVGQALTSMLD